MEPLEAVIELYVSAAGFRLNRPFAAEYHSVYEAGFCGFWIHWELTNLGIHNIVVNPAIVRLVGPRSQQ